MRYNEIRSVDCNQVDGTIYKCKLNTDYGKIFSISNILKIQFKTQKGFESVVKNEGNETTFNISGWMYKFITCNHDKNEGELKCRPYLAKWAK